MLESLLNKVAGLKAWNFVKKRLQHRCFPVKFKKFLNRTPPVAASGNGKIFNRVSIFYYLNALCLKSDSHLPKKFALFAPLKAL